MKYFIGAASLILVFIAITGTAIENKGSSDIVLQGGKAGSISFPHHKHQNNLKDCNLCHNLFPQNSGSIDKLKTEGKLKIKEVMTQCQDCHRQKGGPKNCNGCHKK